MNPSPRSLLTKLPGRAAFALLVVSALPLHAQVAEKKTLTLDGAKKVIAAAVGYAKQHNAPGGAIAVVDDGGNLIAVERIDGTFPAGAMISIGKARTAALFKKPTSFFEDVIKKGRTPMVALNDFTPLQGGVPIVVDGQVVGAVGVSGAASAQQDEELALAGAAALAHPVAANNPGSAPVAHVDKSKVDAAFVKGDTLFVADHLKVNASRRDEPGEAEVHMTETDVFYVLDGSATFVTGGQVVDGKQTGPNEIRGPSIRGGEERRLAKGDVVVIPPGTPHWFREVRQPFVYFVVKPIHNQP